MDAFCRRKGFERALDHIVDSLGIVAATGFCERLHGGLFHSYSAVFCHHRHTDPNRRRL
jgi:hypothetical protein